MWMKLPKWQYKKIGKKKALGEDALILVSQ
jgi:hypothetical protein